MNGDRPEARQRAVGLRSTTRRVRLSPSDSVVQPDPGRLTAARSVCGAASPPGRQAHRRVPGRRKIGRLVSKHRVRRAPRPAVLRGRPAPRCGSASAVRSAGVRSQVPSSKNSLRRFHAVCNDPTPPDARRATGSRSDTGRSPPTTARRSLNGRPTFPRTSGEEPSGTGGARASLRCSAPSLLSPRSGSRRRRATWRSRRG